MTESTLSRIEPHHAVWLVRGAFFAGLVSVAFTLWAIKARALGATAWNLLDAAIILGLAIGVLRRSYLCAWLLFGYHVLNRAVMYFTQGHVPGRTAFSLGVLYFLGITGIAALGPRSRGRRIDAERGPQPDGTPP